MEPQQTIAALATALGGSIGILRVSGPLSETIARRVCRPWPEAALSHRMIYTRLVDPDQPDTVSDREGRSPAVSDREGRSPAVSDREGRSPAVSDREGRSPAVIDQVMACLMRGPR